MNIYEQVGRMLAYGLHHQMIKDDDVTYVRNQVMIFLKLKEIDWTAYNKGLTIAVDEDDYELVFMENIIDWALDTGLLEINNGTQRDLFDSRLMNHLVDRPSNIVNNFYERYNREKKSATDWYYNLSKRSNYIRVKRVAKNIKWQYKSSYGFLDMTINLSKPEKDPKEIAAAKKTVTTAYPSCVLCKENEGFEGNLNRQGRSNHRIIPMTIKEEPWFFQYSPYEYYNEHSILLCGGHKPMKIGRATIERLLSFLDLMPHYFVGSNADLPIVGGSILSHDHFQAGCYNFPIENTDVVKTYDNGNGITLELLKWPLSVVRLRSSDQRAMVLAAEKIMDTWKAYSDVTADIIHETNGVSHNTITPISRRRDHVYELDLVLRNNRCTEDYPEGVFHPHKEIHNIKKENIRLIEVMGLAVLPSRLESQLESIGRLLVDGREVDESLEIHREWITYLRKTYKTFSDDSIDSILCQEVGRQFELALEHAGVFKQTGLGLQQFEKFIETLGEFHGS